MTRSEFLFHAIDVLFHPQQNYRKYSGIKKDPDFCYDERHPSDCLANFYYDPTLMEKGAKLPVVLNIHGGGFVKGDKKHRHSLAKRYAKHGYVCLNINYRLCPKHQFPDPVEDCVNALNSLKKYEEKYNLDLTKVCVTGDSAGAYYATALVALCNDEAYRATIGMPQIEVKPSLLISFCGPYDLIAAMEMAKLPFHLVWDIGRCLLGKDFKLEKNYSNIKEYRYYSVMSPSNFVNSNWCPSFLVMSKKDFFCKGHGEILEQKLKDVNVEVKSFSSTKFLDNHCFHMDMYKKISKECFKQVFEFMDEHLK